MRGRLRAILLAGLVLGVVLACAGLGWYAARARLQPFILEGASDVRVVNESLGSTRLSYETGGQPFAWREQLALKLDREGWKGYSYNFPTSHVVFTAYSFSRNRRFGPVTLTDYAVLAGDPRAPHTAVVTLHLEIHFDD